MTDPRRQRFLPYVRQLADLMGLKDWDIRIADEGPEDPNHRAEMDCRYGRKLAWIHLADVMLEEEPQEQRQCLVHELIHPHFDGADKLARRMLSDDGFAGFRLSLEYGVDA